MPIDLELTDLPAVEKSSKNKRSVWILSGSSILICLGLAVALFIWQKPKTTVVEQTATSPQVAFVTEVYHSIKDNYWQVLSDEQLTNMFVAALSQSYGAQPELTDKNAEGVSALVSDLVVKNPDAKHDQLLAQAMDAVLSNLQPTGRSRLYSQTQTTELSDRVANRDTQTDLFATLDVPPQASDSAVEEAYAEKKEVVVKTATSAAEKQAQLVELDRAYETLNSQASRERYAETQVEPTINGRVMDTGVFYLKIKQFSPTTIEDLQQILQKNQSQIIGPSLIVDLRGNVGGAIDGLPYFLGPFIGNNQYAYQFFSQGKTLDFKTKIGTLSEFKPFKRIVVLVDGQTQSSAEVMAAAIKKYHAGIVVGSTTKGWGTVERVFPLEHQLSDTTKHAVFLVHSLTLDEEGNPIEGTGVKPLVDVTQSNWQDQLSQYMPDKNLIEAVEKLFVR